MRFAIFLIIFALSVGTCALAWRNVKSGRGDRRGATRVVFALLGVMFISWVIGARHYLEPLTEFSHFLDSFLSEQLLNGAILWLAYLALEPYVRRYSPDMLMSWSRLIAGRFRDPRVGRDVLVGIGAGLLLSLIWLGVTLLPPLAGYPPPVPRGFNTALLQGTRRFLSLLLRVPLDALFNAMISTLAFALARIVVKRTWLALVITIAVGALVWVSQAGTEQLWINVLYAVTFSAILMGVLVYFGMFALIVTSLVELIVRQGGLTADLSKQYASEGVLMMALIAALAAFGYYASRGDEPLFGKFET
jgi:hypothetical protein